MLALTGCTIGGSFYMLNFSLTPNAKILSKDAAQVPPQECFPFLRSLRMDRTIAAMIAATMIPTMTLPIEMPPFETSGQFCLCLYLHAQLVALLIRTNQQVDHDDDQCK